MKAPVVASDRDLRMNRSLALTVTQFRDTTRVCNLCAVTRV